MLLKQACVLARGPWSYDSTMTADKPVKLLLSIIELGGYPDFAPLYRELGYEVAVETRMRKAIAFLKKRTPDVIVAEFNFQSDFRDRSSNLESILAVVQRSPDIRVIIFYENEFSTQFEKLSARLPVYKSLVFPVEEAVLRDSLIELAHTKGC
jgi:hypothetical protein